MNETDLISAIMQLPMMGILLYLLIKEQARSTMLMQMLNEQHEKWMTAMIFHSPLPEAPKISLN